MTEILSALHSRYIIDGVQQELTPAQILDSLRGPFGADSELSGGSVAGKIVDESPDPALSTVETDPSMVDRYLSAVMRVTRKPSPIFAAQYTRSRIEKALLDCLWRMGHFGLGDLCLDAVWTWNDSEIGNMAGLYSSVQAAGEFLDSLDMHMRYYSEEKGRPGVAFTADLRPGIDEDSLVELPFGSEKPKLGAASLPSVLNPDPKSWIVYIPFDTSLYRLGGSLLAQALKDSPAVAPQVNDPDYFIDCYEVVRELVEDGIVLSAATVADGGLIAAVKGMTTSRTGACIDISDLRRATGGEDPVRLLFAEVPGALVQIRDIDFDYLDAELLLQDVAFYPLGHPVPGGGVKVLESEKTGIQGILDSLLRNQNGEGED